MKNARRNTLTEFLPELRNMGLMRCCRCKEVKEEKYFSKHNFYTNKYPYCRACMKIGRKNHDLKKIYNLTEEQYFCLLKKQKMVCAICKKGEDHKNHITKKYIYLAVDHCHETQKIRGLLCRNCNLMLGNSKDNIETLETAIKYLKNRGIV